MSENKGHVICIPCNRAFTSIVGLRQHNRDKHHDPPAQAPKVQVQPPAQKPQVQTKNKPVPIPTASVSEAIVCEHCLAAFKSLKALQQHKLASHGWKCTKCPALPPFENGTAWQAHYSAVHPTVAQSGKVTDTKGKKGAAPKDKGKIKDQQFDAKHGTDAETKKVATQPKPTSSGLANANGPTISSPPSKVLTPSVNQNQIALSASDDKVEGQRTSPNLEDQIVSFDERDPLSSKGPTLNLLVEIDPEPRRGRNEVTYQIASDTWSPTMTVSSIGADHHEGEYDIDSLEPLNGSSLQKEQDIILPPRGPNSGERERRSLSGAIVAGNHSRYEPDLQVQNGLDGRYGGARPESPNLTTLSSRDRGVDINQGDLPHDPLRTRRSKRSSAGAHFECRICLSDPTSASNLTATHCGHLFCYECIAAEVLRTSRCPVCKNILALYCLFKLDVGS